MHLCLECIFSLSLAECVFAPSSNNRNLLAQFYNEKLIEKTGKNMRQGGAAMIDSRQHLFPSKMPLRTQVEISCSIDIRETRFPIEKVIENKGKHQAESSCIIK